MSFKIYKTAPPRLIHGVERFLSSIEGQDAGKKGERNRVWTYGKYPYATSCAEGGQINERENEKERMGGVKALRESRAICKFRKIE